MVLKLTVLPPTTGLYIQLCKTPVLQFLEFRTLIISLFLVRLDVSRETDYLYHSPEHHKKSLLPTNCVTKRSTCSLFICTVYMCIHPEHLGLFSRGKPDVFRMYVHNVKREQFHICQTYNPQISL